MIKVKKLFFQTQRTQRTQSFSDLKVHGTCSENPRDFIGMRIIWCGSGDSPRGQSDGRAPAAAGWTVESSQSEESPRNRNDYAVAGDSPRSRRHREHEVGAGAGKLGSLPP